MREDEFDPFFRQVFEYAGDGDGVEGFFEWEVDEWGLIQVEWVIFAIGDGLWEYVHAGILQAARREQGAQCSWTAADIENFTLSGSAFDDFFRDALNANMWLFV